jgi:hypothetical protein
MTAEQEWFADQKASASQPHEETRVVRDDRVYTRSLGKRCPWCSDIFFTYQVEGHERQPYKTDPEVMLNHEGRPINGVGTRETCGDPNCLEREDTHQFLRRLAYRAEHAKNRGNVQPLVAVNLL